MEIKVLGTKGKIPGGTNNHSLHSGILIDGNILMDCGERIFLNTHPELILFTHYHPDHAYFMSTCEQFYPSVPAYGPEVNKFTGSIKMIKDVLIWRDYKITPVPTVHSKKLKSQGYIIEKDKKRIFYSGDMHSIDKEYHPLLKNIDLVITEASFIRRGGVGRKDPKGIRYGHAGIPDLVDFFRTITNHILFTHFGTWFIKDSDRATAKLKSFENTKLKIDIAWDGREINI